MGARFLQEDTTEMFFGMSLVCVLVDSCKRASSDYSQIFKLESLILAQNERWRQA